MSAIDDFLAESIDEFRNIARDADAFAGLQKRAEASYENGMGIIKKYANAEPIDDDDCRDIGYALTDALIGIFGVSSPTKMMEMTILIDAAVNAAAWNARRKVAKNKVAASVLCGKVKGEETK